MAKKVDLNGGNTNDVAPVNEIDLDDVDITTDEIDAHPVESAASVKGLSASELSNPDNIMVHIAGGSARIAGPKAKNALLSKNIRAYRCKTM